MTQRDMLYYEDMKGPRVMVCTNRCDPLFYLTWLKQQRKEEARQDWQVNKEDLFKFRSLSEIRELLINRGEVVSNSEDEGQNVHPEQDLPEEDLNLVNIEDEEPAKK